tara:strand:- start:1065 stop:1562 length:498 start_codon:yes stop_codon:yes gene_type:complete
MWEMKSIQSTRYIRVPAQALWEAITSEHHLEACHPFIKRHSKNSKEHGISDVITYLNGVTFTRESTAWMEGKGYDLLVGKVSEPKNEVKWRIEAVDTSSSKLSISVIPRAAEKLPLIMRDIALVLFVRRQLRLYLDAVTCGIKTWLESGTQIDKSAFKRHAWFSE